MFDSIFDQANLTLSLLLVVLVTQSGNLLCCVFPHEIVYISTCKGRRLENGGTVIEIRGTKQKLTLAQEKMDRCEGIYRRL